MAVIASTSTTTSTTNGSFLPTYVDPYNYGNFSGNNIVSNAYTAGKNIVQGIFEGTLSFNNGNPADGLPWLKAAAGPFDGMGGLVVGAAVHLGYIGVQEINYGNAAIHNAINQADYQSAQSYNLLASQMNQTDSYAAQPSPGLTYEPGNNVYTYSSNGSQLISQQYITNYTGSTLFGDTSGVFNEQQGSPINQNPTDAINTLYNDGFFNGPTNSVASYSDPYASSYSDPYASSYSDSYGASVGVSGDTSVASSSYNGGGSSYGGGSGGYAYGGSGS